jgi:hypothetical protein
MNELQVGLDDLGSCFEWLRVFGFVVAEDVEAWFYGGVMRFEFEIHGEGEKQL